MNGDICYHCDGTGERDFLSGAPCHECGGSGWRKEPEHDDDDAVCDRCRCNLDSGNWIGLCCVCEFEMYRGEMVMRAEYRDANPACELTKYLRTHGIATARDDSCEVHHIIGVGRRVDVVGNLITLSRTVHAWCHQNIQDGRIVCLWRKMTKCELDAETFRYCSGRHIDGWLDINQPTLSVAELPWRELVEKFGTGD